MLIFGLPLFLKLTVMAAPPNLEAPDPLDRLGLETAKPTSEEIMTAFQYAVRELNAQEFPDRLERLETARDALLAETQPTTADKIRPPNHEAWSTEQGQKDRLFAGRFDSIVQDLDRRLEVINRERNIGAIAGIWGAGVTLTTFLGVMAFYPPRDWTAFLGASFGALAGGFMIPNFHMDIHLVEHPELTLRTERQRAKNYARKTGLIAGGVAAVGYSACYLFLRHLANH